MHDVIIPKGFSEEDGLFCPQYISGDIYLVPRMVYYDTTRNRWQFIPSQAYRSISRSESFPALTWGREEAFQQACLCRNALYSLSRELELHLNVRERGYKEEKIVPGVAVRPNYSDVVAKCGNTMQKSFSTVRYTFEEAIELAKKERKEMEKIWFQQRKAELLALLNEMKGVVA